MSLVTKKICGFLIDMDGVLYVEDHPLPGAIETLEHLRARNIPFRFLTNTTMKSRAALVAKLNDLGFQATAEEIFSTCSVAAQWLKSNDIHKLHLLIPEEPAKDFSDFEMEDAEPEAVVIGDMGSQMNFDRLNQAFRMLKNGARLVALQKNKYWQKLDGITLDAGPFVVALEFAAETEAVVIGKPNAAYFETALKDMNLKADQTAMIGDDILTDIKGANDAGLTTFLVRTGKFRLKNLELPDIRPDHVLTSIADLPKFLDSE